MANTKHNLNMTLEEILKEEPAKVTPLKSGVPTPEEEAEAFKDLFEEFWRKNK
jgi:hypothetical protein